MATEKKSAEAVEEIAYDPMRDYVTITLPRATGDEAKEEFVGLNGKAYLIRKGIPVSVPRPVAQIIRESFRQQERQERFNDQQQALLQGAGRALG